MKNKYYAKINRKDYLIILLTLLGFLFLFLNNIVSLIILVVVVTISSNLYNKDIFVYEKNKIYLYRHDNKLTSVIGFITIIALFIGFVFCILGYISMSLIIYYGILFIVFINNLLVSRKVEKDILKNLLDSLDEYTKYLIEEVDLSKDVYEFKLKDTISDKELYIDYKINKNMNNYGELVNKLASL